MAHTGAATIGLPPGSDFPYIRPLPYTKGARPALVPDLTEIGTMSCPSGIFWL